jgi:hypothetical protein
MQGLKAPEAQPQAYQASCAVGWVTDFQNDDDCMMQVASYSHCKWPPVTLRR